MEKKKRNSTAEGKNKKLIKDAFVTSIRSVRNSSKNKNIVKHYDLSGNILKRREAAVYRLLPEVRQRYGQFYSEHDIVTAWANECSVMGCSIDGVDDLYSITLAAAIWMLDELKQRGNLGLAYPYFSKEQEELESIVLPEMFDPCHDELTIRSMVDLIQKRDARNYDERCYLNDSSAQRTEPVQHLTSEKCVDEQTPRERFNSIMALILPTVKERAVERFTSKFWEFLDLFFACDASLYEEYIGYTKESEQIMEECYELYAKVFSQHVQPEKLQYPSVLFKSKQSPTPVDVLHVENNLNLGRSKNILDNGIERLQGMASRGLEYEDRAEEVFDRRIRLILTGHVAQMLPTEEVISEIGESFASKILSFEVDDPYETCFAYLCLLEEGSDIPWAYNAALAVLLAAARKLPWNAFALELAEEAEQDAEWCEKNYDFSEGTESTEEDPQRKDVWEPVDWNEKKAEIYRLKYLNTPLYMPLDSPVPNWKLNLPQIIFGLTGLVMPRNVSDSDGVADDFVKAGI